VLFVYNSQKAKVYFMQPDIIQGERRLVPPIVISPPNGILEVYFSPDAPWSSPNDPKSIIVTGTDNKQVTYDLDGNEIKQ
jgi:hypothetical protein